MHVTRNLFVDREVEIEALMRAWKNRPGLVIVYGRRRIGKTRLIVEWLKRLEDSPKIYYQAIPAKHEVNLSGIAQVAEEVLGISELGAARFRRIDVLLKLISSIVDDVVVVIDEFTQWVKAEPRVSGEIQYFVDHHLPSTGMLLVLTGSAVGVMHRDVLGGSSPLFGRATAVLRVRELELRHLSNFHPGFGDVNLFLTYVLFGGVPHYHALTSEIPSLEGILWETYFSPTAPLRDEPVTLLREEFREVGTYYSILKAIATGYDTPSKISDVTGIHRQHVSKYLATLELVGLVKREVPLLSKKGRYVIGDNALMAWFTVAEPILAKNPYPERSSAVREALNRLNALAPRVYEDVGKTYLVAWGVRKGVVFDEVGRFIHKGTEIDAVAVSRKARETHVAEVKWSDMSETDAQRITDDLLSKAAELPRRLRPGRIVPHIIVRKYLGQEPPGGAVVHELQDVIRAV